jgi:hypothetical protein
MIEGLITSFISVHKKSRNSGKKKPALIKRTLMYKKTINIGRRANKILFFLTSSPAGVLFSGDWQPEMTNLVADARQPSYPQIPELLLVVVKYLQIVAL